MRTQFKRSDKEGVDEYTAVLRFPFHVVPERLVFLLVLESPDQQNWLRAPGGIDYLVGIDKGQAVVEWLAKDKKKEKKEEKKEEKKPEKKEEKKEEKKDEKKPEKKEEKKE